MSGSEEKLRHMKPLAMFALFAGLLLAGCSKPAAKTEEKDPSKDFATNSGTSSPDLPVASITGVASCDEYLNRVDFCLTKSSVPDRMKSAYRKSREQNRSAWKQAASTQVGKEQLESTCKMALDAAKSFFESCK